MNKKKANTEIRGWYILAVAIIFYVIGFATKSSDQESSSLSALFLTGGDLFLLIAIVVGITNWRKSKKSNHGPAR